MKKAMEPKKYEQWEVMDYAEKYIQAAHNALAREEKRQGQRLYDTFGEWKQQNPNNPVAKMNYPDNEYLQVISAYKSYFDKCGSQTINEISLGKAVNEISL